MALFRIAPVREPLYVRILLQAMQIETFLITHGGPGSIELFRHLIQMEARSIQWISPMFVPSLSWQMLGL